MIEAIVEHTKEGMKDVAMSTLDWMRAKAWEKGLEKGRKEGLEGARALLMRQLERRFGTLPLRARVKVVAADPQQVEDWALRVVEADSLIEVLGDP